MVGIGRVGIVGGAGWLGSAIAQALVKSGTVSSSDLTCSYRSGKPEIAVDCNWTNDNAELVENSDVVILSVRPADWKAVDIEASGKLVVSVMAGVNVLDIKKRTGSARVARALPNAAAELGCSYTPIFMRSTEPADSDIARALFMTCGAVDIVSSEDHIDYFTAMSGSGEAFPALLADAMMKDAVRQGIDPNIARRAAQQVIVGAGKLQAHHGLSPSATVKAFVDYRGTTAAGIVEMREKGFEAIVAAGLQAAYRKSQALSKD